MCHNKMQSALRALVYKRYVFVSVREFRGKRGGGRSSARFFLVLTVY